MSIEQTNRDDVDQRHLSLGRISVDFDTYQVSVDKVAVELTYHEFELLRLFLTNLDRIVSYQNLADQLWGVSDHAAIRHLNVIVHRLRVKLGDTSPYHVKTVRGRGYGLLE